MGGVGSSRMISGVLGAKMFSTDFDLISVGSKVDLSEL